MVQTIYVVIAGQSYSHADPQRAFKSRSKAKKYKASLDVDKDSLRGFDWAKIETIAFED